MTGYWGTGYWNPGIQGDWPCVHCGNLEYLHPRPTCRVFTPDTLINERNKAAREAENAAPPGEG